MEITETARDGVLVIQLKGRFDANTAEPVKERLLATVRDQAVRLVVDFTGVEYISSIGLRVLMIVAKRVATTRGKFALCGMAGLVRQVFDLAGFASIVPLFADREAAIQSVAAAKN
jgi:anti-anti-sigma factor